MAELTAGGVALELPPGFDGRATKRPRAEPGTPTPGAQAHADDPSGLAVLHATTVPLPIEVGDFGSNVVDVLGPNDVFVAVIEYDRSATDTALFRELGPPTTLPRDSYSTGVLQRWIKGQCGAQRFFSSGGRAFCVYAVLGSDAQRSSLAAKVDAVLANLSITPTVGGAAKGSGPGASPTTTTLPVPDTVAELIAAQSDLTEFAGLLVDTRVERLLRGDAPHTVFAFRDDAVSASDQERLSTDSAYAALVVNHLIVDGTQRIDDLQPGETLVPLSGAPLTIGRGTTAKTVNEAVVVRPDLDARNGVVHVIDRIVDPTR